MLASANNVLIVEGCSLGATDERYRRHSLAPPRASTAAPGLKAYRKSSCDTRHAHRSGVDVSRPHLR